MTNVRDVVSPTAFAAFQVFGYLVFAAAISIVVMALFEATLHLAREWAKFRQWQRQQTFKFVPPKAKIITFPAKKTRSRLVIQ